MPNLYDGLSLRALETIQATIEEAINKKKSKGRFVYVMAWETDHKTSDPEKRMIRIGFKEPDPNDQLIIVPSRFVIQRPSANPWKKSNNQDELSS